MAIFFQHHGNFFFGVTPVNLKMTPRPPLCFLSSQNERHKLILSSLQNQLPGCRWVTSHGSQQWRRPGGKPHLLVQLRAPGQVLSGWGTINQQRGQEGQAQASLTACCIWIILSASPAAQHRVWAEGLKRPNLPCPRF